MSRLKKNENITVNGYSNIPATPSYFEFKKVFRNNNSSLSIRGKSEI